MRRDDRHLRPDNDVNLHGEALLHRTGSLTAEAVARLHGNLTDVGSVLKAACRVFIPRVLLDEAGADDTGRNRHDPDTEKCNENRERLAEHRHGVNVAVADRQESGHTPPDAGEGIAEGFGLHLMLHAVHTQRRGEHQHGNDEHRGENLVSFFLENGRDDAEGIILRIDAEQMKNAHDPQHPEHDKAVEEVKGEDGQQIDHAVVGVEKAQSCAQRRAVGVEQVRRPDAEDIFRAEDPDGKELDRVQHLRKRRKGLEGIEKHHGDIEENDRDDEPVEGTAGQVFGVADLDDVEDAFFLHKCSFLR